MTYPKISIITPSYNQGKFIEATIQSVLDQQYPILEFIVMDGGSADQTVRILKKYQKHLTWFSEKDGGQADAINKGLRYSTGSILTYLNSDDTYEPNTLKVVSEYFVKHPTSHFVYGEGGLIDSDSTKIGAYNTLPMNHETLFAHCGISQPAAFWSREVYRVIGEFDASYHFTMDYEYWIRVSKKFPLNYVKGVTLANTRIHDQAKTSRATHQLHLDAVRATFTHYHKLHPDWINTLADGVVHQYKFGSPFERAWYWLYMTCKTSMLHMQYNHELPPKLQQQYYVRWLKEAVGGR